jgi:hypothetical protein
MTFTWSSMLRRQSRASMERKLGGGVLAQGPMPFRRGVADFGYPPESRGLADRPRARVGTLGAAGGLACARVNLEDGLVFSLGLSYSHGRASSVPGAMSRGIDATNFS